MHGNPWSTFDVLSAARQNREPHSRCNFDMYMLFVVATIRLGYQTVLAVLSTSYDIRGTLQFNNFSHSDVG